MLLNVTKTKESRIALIESSSENAFQQLLHNYWNWHYNDTFHDATKTLLSTDLGWEDVPQRTTPPVGEIISPLGYALAHEKMEIREAALKVLDATVRVTKGTALIGEECTPLEIDEFDIGVYPVTNAQYHRFVQETGYESPKHKVDATQNSYENYALKGDHPVVWVSCKDADAYANHVGGRLPTFEEWQYAARGTDDRLFPWGHEIDKPRCNTAELGADGTTPVGAFKDGISPCGCYDMLGNVWECTATPYDDEKEVRVTCGGAWYYNHDFSTCISYDYFSTNYAEFVIGFRIAR